MIIAAFKITENRSVFILRYPVNEKWWSLKNDTPFSSLTACV
jgi:hypothetical protein